MNKSCIKEIVSVMFDMYQECFNIKAMKNKKADI